MTIRSLSFLALFYAFSGPLLSAEMGLLECALKKSSTVPQLKDAEGIFKEISALPEGAQNFLVNQDDQRVQMISQIMGKDVLNPEPWYRQSVGPDGQISHNFRLGNMMSEEWEKPEYLKQIVQSVCDNYFSEISPFCVESFFKRRENYQSFFKNNAATIEQIAERAPVKEREDWLQALAGKKISADSVTEGNLKYGSIVKMRTRDLIPIFHNMPPIVFNKSRMPVGLLIPITNDGKTEFFVGEFVGEGDLFQQSIRWPYSMVFGQSVQDQWNAVFKARHGGELYVDGIPMDQFIAQAQLKKGS